MIRVIIFLVVGYIGYRLVRRWFLQSRKLPGRRREESAGRIDDVMVKDPQCGAYFPRRDAIVLKGKEGDLLFCSAECRNKYRSDRFDSKS
jgi:uncharacterized protein